jgi:hypothetical protein
MENENKEMGKMEGTTIVRTIEQIADQFELTYDSRFRFWGKIVSGVDLSQKGGYALQGEFFHGATVIPNRAWVVVAAESGSRKNHSYEYRLLQNHDGTLVRVKHNIDKLKDELPAQVYANALNNTLYAYAARIWYNSQRPDP